MNDELTTKDQKFYEVDGQLKAEITVYVPHEDVSEGAPFINECRHAVLPLKNGGYTVYDRLLSRIINGVYYGSTEDALEAAQYYNTDFEFQPQDMAPNGSALGLIYPEKQEEGN